MTKLVSKTQVPRNFLLLDALNKSKDFTHVTYGLTDEDENDKNLRNNYTTMKYWNCSLIYDDGQDMNIFTAQCICTEKYPHEMPKLKFSKESMNHKRIKKVSDSEGNLVESYISSKWNEAMSLGEYLNTVLKIIQQN